MMSFDPVKEAGHGGDDLLHSLDEANDLGLRVGHLLKRTLYFLYTRLERISVKPFERAAQVNELLYLECWSARRCSALQCQ